MALLKKEGVVVDEIFCGGRAGSAGGGEWRWSGRVRRAGREMARSFTSSCGGGTFLGLLECSVDSSVSGFLLPNLHFRLLVILFYCSVFYKIFMNIYSLCTNRFIISHTLLGLYTFKYISTQVFKENMCSQSCFSKSKGQVFWRSHVSANRPWPPYSIQISRYMYRITET